MPDASSLADLEAARRRALRRVMVGVVALLSVMAAGVVGYVVLGWGLFDALYMVVVTISTVGYGEIRPVDTTALRVHTMLLITLGVVASGYTIAAILQLIT